ncbi:C-C chemokine receptor type 7-like [Heptranchias perlo]|uniref:C-C chemokine receptor type 7-like n=1 Tax=Heptranchias perlo TaxID=212740 RepID=UPI00355A1B44
MVSATMANSAPTPDYSEDFSVDTIDYSDIPSVCVKNDVQKLISTLQPCIYSLVFILGLVGNSLVLGTYIYHKRLKSMTDLYLLNLAIADILFLFTLPFQAASSVTGWIFGTFICRIVQSLYKMNLYSGFLFLMCISVDRYFVIVRAAAAHRLRSKRLLYSRFICLIVWLVSVFLSLPQFVYTKVEIKPESICLVSYTDSMGTWMKVFTLILQLLVGFFLPMVVMVFCYSVTIKTLLQARNFQKHKAIKLILVVVLIFIVFQAPYNILTILKTMETLRKNGVPCHESKLRDIAVQVTSGLAYTRCCLNPILYVFVGVKFRNNLLSLLQHAGCIEHRGPSTSRTNSGRRLSVANTEITNTFTI